MPACRRAVAIVCFCALVVVAGGELWSQDAAPVWTIPLFKPGQLPAGQNQPSQLTGTVKYRIDLFGGKQLGGEVPGGKVIVPSLKGLTWAEADEKLAPLNLESEKKNENARRVDLVDIQVPKAGTEVARGSTVGLRLVARTPDMTGKSLGAAYDLLKEGGFKIRYFKGWDKDYKVTGQSPRPGKLEVRGRTITLQCNVAVPDVRKKTVAEAKKLLEKSDLYVQIAARYRDSDIVYDQGVRPGKMIPRRFQVKLSPGVTVPDITNASLATAESLLSQQGIPAKIVSVRQVATRNLNDHGRAVVSAQGVRGGGYIFRGKTLELQVVQGVYLQQRVPEVRVRAPVLGNGYNEPVQQTRCPECGNFCAQCKCFVD